MLLQQHLLGSVMRRDGGGDTDSITQRAKMLTDRTHNKMTNELQAATRRTKQLTTLLTRCWQAALGVRADVVGADGIPGAGLVR